MQTATTDEVLQLAINRIVRSFAPVKIVLFGSRARGDAREDSDYDLLVVLPAVEDRFGATVALMAELGDLPMSKDIIVATQSEVEKGGRFGSIVRAALREGRVVYAR